VLIPHEYILQKYYQYAGYPQFKKTSNTYIAGCPICREGSSWGKKRRSIYIADDNVICCHNCGWYSDAVKWVQEVSGMTFNEIVNEAKNYDILPLDVLSSDVPKKILTKPAEPLPFDCINLFDSAQIEYYKNNKIVCDALDLVKKRKLDIAINRPETLWATFRDKVHKNRIIIPFYNDKKDIIFYQSRLIYEKDAKSYPKYLSKINGEKSLYNINKISPDLEYIFIFEGPIDSFFVKNGTAVAGIQENSNNTFSTLQEQQLATFKLYKKIWVLDSQWQDKASRIKTQKLLDQNETVFIWPESLGKRYKDINELCIDLNKAEIKPQFFIDNSANGLKAKLLMTSICR
jgi:hypothetical protein